jgi:hypothetical protein
MSQNEPEVRMPKSVYLDQMNLYADLKLDNLLVGTTACPSPVVFAGTPKTKPDMIYAAFVGVTPETPAKEETP